MFFRKERKQAAALTSLMSQTRDTMVCLEFNTPIDPREPQSEINRKLRDCYVVDASYSFARYFGFKNREDILDKSMMDVMGADIPSWFIDYGNEVETKNFDNLERLVSIPVNGQAWIMRIQMHNIFEKELLVRQWIMIRDVSAEEAAKLLVEENERFKILAIEAAGLSTFKLEFGETADATGRMEINGTAVPDWWDLVHADDKQQLRADFDRFFRGATEKLHGFFRTRDTNGVETWHEAWGVASDRNDQQEATGVYGVLCDRTEQKALELKLITTQRLESLGILAGGIAHDFNNVLSTMVGAVELAKRKQDGISDLMRPIDDAADQLTNLCDQLLTYAGRNVSAFDSIDIGHLVSTFQELLKLSIGKDITLEIESADFCWVRGDRGQLRQLLMNLVKNASEAMEGKSGRVLIRTRVVAHDTVWAAQFRYGQPLTPGNYVEISVSDQGSGIDPTEIERLFDPFFTTRFTGRGLGLAVVLGVVNGHNGAINVASSPGVGTTVSVAIPLHTVRPAEPAEVVTPGNIDWHETGYRILVVDDDHSVLTMAGLLLDELGLSVRVCSSGAEAVALYRERPGRFEFVLMDVTMPGLDGIQAATEILALDPEAKIILSSGYSDITFPEAIAEATLFLKKPYRLGQLQQSLEALLKKQ